MSATLYEKQKGSGEWWLRLTVARAECVSQRSADRRSTVKVGPKGVALALSEEANGLLVTARLQDIRVRARDILRQAAQNLRGRHQGASPDPGCLTVAEYSASWLSTVQGSTHDKYKLVYRKHIAPVFGSLPLNRLPKRMVREWLQALEKTHRSAPGYFAIFAAMLAQAVRDEEIPVHPFPSIRTIRRGTRKAKREPRAFTLEELGALIRALREITPDFNRRGVFEFQAATGVRIGEALALRWTDLDLETGRAKIARRFYKGKLGPTKGRNTRRVWLGTGLVRDLRRLRTEQRRVAMSGGRRPGLYVFQGRSGKPWSWDASPRRDIFVPTLIKAGLLADGEVPRNVGLGSHTLRHTWASHRLQEHVPVPDVSEALGHSSPAITLSMYAHAMPKENRDRMRVELDAIV